MGERAADGTPDSGQDPAVALTAREAAARLGVAERTVRRAIARGELPAAKRAGAFAIAPADLERFVQEHGLPGYAPTQGHIPSAVPYLPWARDRMLDGTLRSAMFLGKGSLFLGRMTNLADGASLLIEAQDEC